MLRAILNKSWRQHPTKNQLYGHLPLITKTIQVRRTRHAGHCWRSRDELISDVLLWTPSYGQAKAGRPARTYIQQHTGCSPEDQPEAMKDREEWRERVRDIRTGGTTWLWWMIPVTAGALETISKTIEKSNRANRQSLIQIETTQTTILLRSDRTLRRVLETWGDLFAYLLCLMAYHTKCFFDAISCLYKYILNIYDL